MDRRVVFSGWLFPIALVLPQLAVTVVFFFWPAAQAIRQSVQGQLRYTFLTPERGRSLGTAAGFHLHETFCRAVSLSPNVVVIHATEWS